MILNNNSRFKLPSFNIIGGSTKTFEVKLKDLFGESAVFFCNGISEDRSIMIDTSGVNVIPRQNCIYILNDKDVGYQYYMWSGDIYVPVFFLLSVSNFAGFATNLIIEKKCNAIDAEVHMKFDFTDTINVNGKYIYQIAACSESAGIVNYMAEQGILIISKNIDFETNILNDTDDFIYEDDNLLFVYTETTAYIVGNIPYERDWLSLSSGGSAITPDENVIYVISSGNYTGKYVWDKTISLYIEYED